MTTFNRPPRDGWTLIEAGREILLRVPEPKIQELQNKIHRLRGGILSDAYNIESILDTILIAYFFKDSDTNKDASAALFQDEVLRNLLSFDKKLKLFKSILQASLKGFEDAKVFYENADQFRQIRNIFSHYPTWIEPIEPETPGVIENFKAYIAKSENILFEICDDQIQKWGVLVNAAIKAGESTIKYLSPKEKEPESP